jgi:vesicle-fusing ATPase
MLVDETDVEFSSNLNEKFSIKGNQGKAQSLFKSDFNFESLGIGGLDKEISDIFRRAFASRRFPPSVLKKYGISHVKGVLLYGPPGTGKTLMARQLAKALRSKEPKIVNGPELFDKYVGETEKKIRDLFAPAQADSKQFGEESPLHIIIFDEFDSVCRQRGSVTSGTGVHDSAVNQLLAMMDGVDALNNILLIGMTNRKDMLDEAVLRPGRFEVHVEVSLPNEDGRLQILKIHTKTMEANKLMASDVDLDKLAKQTKNFTGADIEALVKSASSYAFNRGHDVMNFTQKVVQTVESKVEMQDFLLALEEVKPQFGADTDRFEMYLRGGIIDYGARLKRVKDMLKTVINQLRTSKSQQLVSLLLEGETGAGKTALAAWAATTSDFPYLKVITADTMLGLTDVGKINAMVRIFEDAYRTNLAIIVLDDIERLIEFVDIGARFSNQLLQTLMVLIKRVPTKIQNKLVIIGTTSSMQTMRDLGIASGFNFTINVPTLSGKEELLSILSQMSCSQTDANAIAENVKSITIKKFLLILELATQGTGQLTYEKFARCYHDYIPA